MTTPQNNVIHSLRTSHTRATFAPPPPLCVLISCAPLIYRRKKPPSISLTHTCVGLQVTKFGLRTREVDPVGRVTSAKGVAAVAVTLPTWPPARWADGSNHSKSAGRAVRRAGTGRGLQGGGPRMWHHTCLLMPSSSEALFCAAAKLSK